MSIPPLIRYFSQNNKIQFQEIYNQQRNACGVTTQMFQLFCSKNLTKDLIQKMNPEQKDATQKSLLFYAVGGDQDVQICEHLDSLIQNQDAYKSTALMYAAKFARVQWVQYLVEDECGFKDLQGRTALMYCIGSLSSLQEEYMKYSNTEIELKLKIIDFLFDYEWHILDNAGQTCIDYLKQTKIDQSFIQYLETRFVKHCIAYGTPRGVLVSEETVKMRHEDNSHNSHRGQNIQIKSVYQEIVRLNEEVMRWKTVCSKIQNQANDYQNQQQNIELIKQLQIENQLLKTQQNSVQLNTQIGSQNNLDNNLVQEKEKIINQQDIIIKQLQKDLAQSQQQQYYQQQQEQKQYQQQQQNNLFQNQQVQLIKNKNNVPVPLSQEVMNIISDNNLNIDNVTPNRNFKKPIFDNEDQKDVVSDDEDNGDLSAAQKKRIELQRRIKERINQNE